MSSNNNKSLYDILGVDRTASSADIKKAFLKMAKVHHPDKGGNEEEFKKILKASEVLSDEQMRSIYDATGQIPGENGAPGGESGGGSGGGPFNFPFDIGNLFGMFGGNGGSRMRRGGKPPPRVEHIHLPLAHFYNGHSFTIRLDRTKNCIQCSGSGAKRKEPCHGCRGQGFIIQNIQMGPMTMQSRGPCPECVGQGFKIVEQCTSCSGKGKLSDVKELDVKLQAGAPSGENIIFQEACSDMEGFEKPGDIHFIIEQAELTGWKRVGTNSQHLETSVSLSLGESLIGCTVTLDNHPGYIDSADPLTVEIPPGSFQGDVYCLSGLGMPIRGEVMRYGDLYIRIQVTIKPEDRKLFTTMCQEPLRQVFGEKVRSISGRDVKKGLYLARI